MPSGITMQPGLERTKNFGLVLSAVLLGALLAVFSGLVLATSNLILSGLLFGLLALPILFFFPSLLLWTVLIGGLVVSGVILMYVPSLRILRWVIPISAMLLLLSVLVLAVFSASRNSSPAKMSASAKVGFLFLGICAMSAVLNWQGVGMAIFGVKNYFQVFTLYLAFLVIRWQPGLFKQFTWFMIIVAVIQLPFAVHQLLYFVPMREGIGHGIVAQDIIAGTFGGDVEGGGSNGALSAFLFIALALVLSLWKTGLLRGIHVAILVPVFLVPVFFNESKISLIFLAVVVGLIFFREIASQPGRVFIGAVLSAVVGIGMLYVYSALHPSAQASSPLDLIKLTVELNTSEDVGYGALELNRLTSLEFWWRKHGLDDPLHTLIGHGLGASRDASGTLDLATTLAMQKYYGLGIGLTAVSSLLWDVGIVGFGIVVMWFVVAFIEAKRLAAHYASEPFNHAVFVGFQASIVVMLLSLIHKNFFVFDQSYQVLVFSVLGFIAYAARNALSNSTVAQS